MSQRAQVAWTAELARERLKHLKARIPALETPAPSPYQGYLDAAAVLAWFDPATLKPLDPATRASVPLPELLAACVEVTDGKCRFRLQHDVRKQALKGLVQRSAIGAALAANPVRPDAPLQRILEACLLGKEIPVEQLTPDEVSAAVEVVEWLDGVIPGLPDAKRLRQRLLFEELLKPLRRLAGAHFRGRKAELEQLRRYIAEDTTSLEDRKPLIVHGPGGMGKSTLLARLILEYVDHPADERFSFAYLDFDHPSLTIEEPLLLLAEILRQLGVQYPSVRDHAEQARAELVASQSEGMAPMAFQSVTTLQMDVGELLAVLRTVDAQDKPFLLVLDTFEEVQYTSHALLHSLWEFIGLLQNALPGLRTVIAGRAPIEDPWFKTMELKLGELDRAAAEGFLDAQGITDTRLVGAIVSQIGGNPLSLKLAAEVVRKEGTLVLSRVFLPFAREAQIQGQLYRRILGHIHDPEVRKLAHPGLVLRVVTSALIAEVLAGPCSVAVLDEVRARALFDELSREVALVRREGDVLRHRQDVRRVMLGLLRADQPGRVEEIHRRAVAFHEKRGTLLDRAEEIYHRLCLGEDPQTVDQRWMTGVEPYLRSATEELPLRQRAFLTSRLGIDLDERTRREADLADWERDAEKRVRERLYVGRVEQLEEALRILDERVERSEESALILLEAQVLERLERMPEAQRVAAAAVSAAKQRSGAGLLEALRTASRIDAGLHRDDEALSKLEEAAGLALGLGQITTYFQIELDRLRMLLRLGGRKKDVQELTDTLRKALSGPFGSQIQQLLREEVAKQLGFEPVDRDDSLIGKQDQALNDALLEAFPSRSALEMLARFELGMRLSTIASSHLSLREAVFQLVRWAESKYQLHDLVAGARRRNPENPKLAAVAADFFPDPGFRGVTPAGDAPRGLQADLLDTDFDEEGKGAVVLSATQTPRLPHKTLLEIHAATVRAGLARSREALLSGLDAHVVAGLVSAGSASDQILLDLTGLNEIGRLRDDTIPLQVWLQNAVALTGPRKEGAIFQRALEAIHG